MDEALSHQQAGRYLESAHACEQILKLDPANAEGLHLVGMVAFQSPKVDNAFAIDLIQQAIAIDGKAAQYRSDLATILWVVGRLDEAKAQYREVLAIMPNSAETLCNLGFVFLTQGKVQEATEYFERAIAIKPGLAEIHFHLGNARKREGRLDEAIQCFEKAVTLKANYAEAYYNIGDVLLEQDRTDMAAARFEQALAVNPHMPEAHNGLGAARQAQTGFDRAVGHYERALLLRPDYAEAHSNYGSLIESQGSYTPSYHDAASEGTRAFGHLESLARATAHYERALDLRPDLIETRFNLGMAQLRAGDYLSGWINYESRWKTKKSPLKNRHFSQPQWRGEPLNGARILLHAEQGLGDTLQFIRYIPMVQAVGGTIVLAVQSRLRRLLAEIPGIADVLSWGDPLPSFDWHCPLISLPLAFKTTLDTIPAQTPYLSAHHEAQMKVNGMVWPSGGLKVGLCWSGTPTFLDDPARFRSVPFELLNPLMLEGVELFSLQIDEAVAQIATAPRTIIDLSPYVSDMADTAAQLQQLDLVITVDTAIAHLAGALGVQTWVLLPFTSDWRWLQTRTDSPWYPTMRLFRQPKPGDWKSVIAEASSALQSLIQPGNCIPSVHDMSI